MRGGSSPQKGGQAAQALGRSRGGFSTKIHVSVDGLGNPLRFILTGGQQHDITQAEELIAGYAGEHVLADKGYDAQEFRQHILELGMMPVIPPRSNRKAPADYDRHLYRERHLVECFINKIKHYRRFTRFDDAGHQIPRLPGFTAAISFVLGEMSSEPNPQILLADQLSKAMMDTTSGSTEAMKTPMELGLFFRYSAIAPGAQLTMKWPSKPQCFSSSQFHALQTIPPPQRISPAGCPSTWSVLGRQISTEAFHFPHRGPRECLPLN